MTQSVGVLLKSWFPHQLVSGISAVRDLPLPEALPYLPSVLALCAHRFSAVRRAAVVAISELVRRDLSLFPQVTNHPKYGPDALLCLGVAVKYWFAESSCRVRGHHTAAFRIARQLLERLQERSFRRIDPYLQETPPAEIANVIRAFAECPEMALLILKRRLSRAGEREALALLSLAWRLGDQSAEVIRGPGLQHRSRAVAKRTSTILDCWKQLGIGDVVSLTSSRSPELRHLGFDLLGQPALRDNASEFVTLAAKDLSSRNRRLRNSASALIIAVWGRLAGEAEWTESGEPHWLNAPSALSSGRFAGMAGPGFRTGNGRARDIKYRRPVSAQYAELDARFHSQAHDLATLLLPCLEQDANSTDPRASPIHLAVLWVASRLVKHLTGELKDQWLGILMFYSLSAETDVERKLGSGELSFLCPENLLAVA